MNEINLKALYVHDMNVKAGWWPNDRNRPETLMLVISEVSEAVQGEDNGLHDDKLPDEYMFDVELADTAIRLLDLCGIDGQIVDDDWPYRMYNIESEIRGDIYYDMFRIVNYVSNAMEGHRKGNLVKYADNLWNALAAVYVVAREYNVELERLIDKKMAFNATREDHKLENRLKDGGKSY
jgi:hypothetical protein